MWHHRIELYECEVCDTQYERPEGALACEATGRPSQRFQLGDRVVLADGDYREQFPGTVFVVRAAHVSLDKPGLAVWEDGTPGNHMVTYVIEGDCDHCRITFVPEQHLAPEGGVGVGA